MRVLFTNTVYQKRVEFTSLISVVPPLDLAHCAALVRQQVAAADVAIIDANVEGLSGRAHEARVRAYAPDVLVVTAATYAINGVASLLSRLHDLPARTVLIGTHGTALPEETLATIRRLDVVVRGEPEETVLELVQALEAGGALDGIPGLTWREGDEVHRTGRRSFNQMLDELPMPARDLLPNHLYSSPYSRHVTALRTTRGCPGKCTFCDSHLLFGSRTRTRSATRVADEVAHCLTHYGTRYFAIIDHTFTAHRSFVKAFCNELISRGLNRRIRFVCNTRVDMLSDDLLALMRKAGCLQIGIGMESSDDAGLAAVQKGITEDQLRAAVKRIKKHGIIAMGYAIVGLPEHTREDVLRTKEKLLEFDPHTLQLSFATPLPGTQLWARCRKEERILSDNWDDYVFLRKSIIRGDHLAPAELTSLRNGIIKDFYLRPKKLVQLATFFLLRARVDPRAAAFAGIKVLTNLFRG